MEGHSIDSNRDSLHSCHNAGPIEVQSALRRRVPANNEWLALLCAPYVHLTSLIRFFYVKTGINWKKVRENAQRGFLNRAYWW
jgi:hypothetical protein